MHKPLIQRLFYTLAPPACITSRSGVFNATFLQNGSDKRQQSGRIKAVGCWFESGPCVGAFKRRLSPQIVC